MFDTIACALLYDGSDTAACASAVASVAGVGPKSLCITTPLARLALLPRRLIGFPILCLCLLAGSPPDFFVLPLDFVFGGGELVGFVGPATTFPT